jgi:putative aldouronate transport system substrate-binding protein
MRKRLSKLVSAGMCLAVFAGLVSGCSVGKKEADSKAAKSKEVQKPEKISLFVRNFVSEENGQKQLADEFKRLTGIELDITQPVANQYWEKMNLMLASGDVADVVHIFEGKLPTYASQGALADITSDIQNSPAFQKMDSKDLNNIKIGGKFYAAPIENGPACVTYLRGDLLKKTGKSVPTNYSEYVDMLKAFKSLDPNLIPFTGAGFIENYPIFEDFYQDALPEFYEKDGKWVDGFMQPEMEKALERMRSAYADGLLDKEIITNQTSTCREKWAAGRVAVFPYWANDWAKTLNNSVKGGPVGKEAELIAIPAIKESKYRRNPPSTFAITKNAKNPEGIFKYFLEYIQDGGEGTKLFTAGVDNVHNVVKDGVTELAPSLSNPKTQLDRVLISPALTLTKINLPGYKYNFDPKVQDALNIAEKDSEPKPNVPVSKTLNKVNADLKALREQTIAKAVLGQLTPKEACDSYKKEATNLGMDSILTEMNNNK